jgi:hypothetical protein
MGTRLTAGSTAALVISLGLITAACSQSDTHVRLGQQREGDSTAHVISRRPLDPSTFHIVSVDGNEALLLTDTTIITQLTDAGLQHVSRGADSSMRKNGAVSRMFAGMVSGLLGPLLNHAIEYDLHDLASASYSDGRIVLKSRDGHEPFGDVKMFGHQLMEGFSPTDARDFATRAEQARGRLK